LIGGQHAQGTGAIGKMNVMEAAFADLPMATPGTLLSPRLKP
jgi:hypothetical protein